MCALMGTFVHTMYNKICDEIWYRLKSNKLIAIKKLI